MPTLLQSLLLQAIQEALEEQTIHGYPFKANQSLSINSISGSCNGWLIYIMEYPTTIHIQGNERYYDIPTNHPKLLEEIINTIHKIARYEPTPQTHPVFRTHPTP